MTIEPQTNIKLLSNVPLDSTYKDTLTFSSIAEQSSYFSGKAKYSFSSCRYQRETGQMYVECNAENVFDCNYIMFQNANFGGKWFYAFIERVEYLNPKTTAITFEIDVLQTWYYNYTVKECFVEREHVADDSIGANTIPENIEHGPYVTTATKHYKATDFWAIGLFTEPIGNIAEIQEPGIVGGFPVSCYYIIFHDAFSGETMSYIRELCESYAKAGKSDAIIGWGVVPKAFCSRESGVNRQTVDCAPRTVEYTPRNNKLYTFPYTALAIVCPGQGGIYRYELFNDPNEATMQISGGFGLDATVCCVPIDYAGNSYGIEHAISIKNWPTLPWVSNIYQNWVANSKASIITGTIGNVVKIAGGVISNGIPGVGSIVSGGLISSGISGIASTIAEIYDHSIVPDKMNGSAAAGDILTICKDNGFYTYCRCIQPEYARIIDDYFDMYGYAVNRVKVPDISSRPSWNFVKTRDAVITGNCPVDDLNKIRTIFDNGITFWHGDYVGDYSRNNK